MNATDADSGEFGRVMYFIVGGNTGNHFVLNNETVRHHIIVDIINQNFAVFLF